MNWRDFPPLTSLRAFEAAARNLSYSDAGRELNVSHAAIAQQVKALETFLGIRLVQRSGRGIALTADGGLLSERLSHGFEDMAAVIRSLNAAAEDRPLHVTMTPSFAVNWFMPRMPQFNADHPDVGLIVNPTPDVIDLTRSDCDVAIRFGAGTWKGLEAELLVPSNFVIVGAPALVEGRWDGELPNLVKLPWLQELGSDEVQVWLSNQNIDIPPDTAITTLPGYMVGSALRAGQGITTTARVFVEEDLAAGRLMLLYEDKNHWLTGYHLVWRSGVQRPALKTFLRWIRAAAKEETFAPSAIPTL